MRHLGLSEVTVAQIERARRVVPIVSVQNRYNLTDREWEAEVDYSEREGLAFLPWFPLAAGALDESGPLARVARRHGATPYQIALAWLLARSPAMLVIPGTSIGTASGGERRARRRSSSRRRTWRSSRPPPGRPAGTLPYCTFPRSRHWVPSCSAAPSSSPRSCCSPPLRGGGRPAAPPAPCCSAPVRGFSPSSARSSCVSSSVVVIDAGQVGVRHAFGEVDPQPLLPGVRFVTPWSSVERFSSREEQFPERSAQAEQISALSSEQMGMQVDVAVRWQIDPMQAPSIFRELGGQEQIQNVVLNAIRNGVRDGIVQYSINDIAQRNRIAGTMQAEVDSALVTQPRAGGEPFRIATVTAFFLRDLQPPPQVVQAINNKIAQEQQIATERHRVEVAQAPGRAAAAPEPDADGGGADQAVPRGAAGASHLEQRGADRADGGRDAGAGHRGAAEESDAAVVLSVIPERSEGAMQHGPFTSLRDDRRPTTSPACSGRTA